MSKCFKISPGGKLTGSIRIPGDKSMSHRSVILGALAEGVTRVSGLLEGEDILATIAAFRAMGVNIEGPDEGQLVICGVGLNGLRQPQHDLDMGNSGTAMRLLSGLLSGQSFPSCLSGDKSLSGRPMRRVVDPLTEMGAHISTAEGGTPPLQIIPVNGLRGIDYQMPMASAQVKSCLLLAGLYAEGKTCVTEPAPTRDHTERMLRGFGYPVSSGGSRVCLEPGFHLKATDMVVPGDISSAAFFMVGASIAPGSHIEIRNVGTNPTRTGILFILKQMGADIELKNERTVGGEPVADLIVQSAPLHGIHIDEAHVPLAIDEFPAILIAAAAASGETILSGAEELRVKESDRIAAMARGLTHIGVDVTETADGMRVRGGEIQGGTVDSHGDHRIAMAFSMAGLLSNTEIYIEDCDNVSTSFPDFQSLAESGGLDITVISK
ncbi:MAG: 3-phosphoshikimate 1-carboxyvinyltransferase [Gammaproteobacteria bacterium]|nr:3-phosphoshikimate 1-carboxyvinyltransferase [Gammaproteobacteria bacterium]